MPMFCDFELMQMFCDRNCIAEFKCHATAYVIENILMKISLRFLPTIYQDK